MEKGTGEKRKIGFSCMMYCIESKSVQVLGLIGYTRHLEFHNHVPPPSHSLCDNYLRIKKVCLYLISNFKIFTNELLINGCVLSVVTLTDSLC